MSEEIVIGVREMYEMFSNVSYVNTWSHVTTKDFAQSYPSVNNKPFILTELKQLKR